MSYRSITALVPADHNADSSILPSGKKDIVEIEWLRKVCSVVTFFVAHTLTVSSSNTDASTSPRKSYFGDSF